MKRRCKKWEKLWLENIVRDVASCTWGEKRAHSTMADYGYVPVKAYGRNIMPGICSADRRKGAVLSGMICSPAGVHRHGSTCF